MITREQVADLQPGDVVELSWPGEEHPEATITARGPLHTWAEAGDTNALFVARFCVRHHNGDPVYGDRRTLIVVSRAPRPLYVNHPRTEPVPGDVACDAVTDDRDPAFVWCYLGKPGLASWCDRWGYTLNQSDLSDRLRLLVDGVTGLVVP